MAGTKKAASTKAAAPRRTGTQRVEVEGKPVDHKTDAQLEKENEEAVRKAQKERAEAEADQADVAARDAETRAEELRKAAEEAEDAAKATGKKAGGGVAKGDLEDLKQDMIDHGKAPVLPGPEKPVDPDDAAKAKANRGRGLGG